MLNLYLRNPASPEGDDRADIDVLGGTIDGGNRNFERFAIQDASLDLVAIADRFIPETIDYLKSNGIRLVPEAAYAVGGITVAPIVDCGAGRFDFANGLQENPFDALVLEALDADTETVVDLVAWPLDRPQHVMTMFGRCALLGAFEAMNPASYFMNYPLPMHRTPLAYMQAGFRGAAVITPHRAARMIIDLPGRIAAQDAAHGRELKRLIDTTIRRDRVVVAPVAERRAA